MLYTTLVLFTALFAGLTVSSVLSRVNLSLAGSDSRALAGYLQDAPPPDMAEQLGSWLLRRFPSLVTIANPSRNLRWLMLSGASPTVATTIGLSALLGIVGLALPILTGLPITLVLTAFGASYPFVRLRRQANLIRRSVLRALPELTALMAAEMAAGNPPDRALERATEWGGPLALLMRKVVERARATSRPVFGRGDLPGMLVEVVGEYDLPALKAFATQIDLAARKGAAGPELMEGLARTLIIEYKDRALRQAEALDNRLAVPSVLFFFLPFMFLLLAPLLIPLMAIL